jgi:hypothetical protein
MGASMSLDESLATDPFGKLLIKQANEWRAIGETAERDRIITILRKNSSELGWIQLDIDQLIKAIERKTK